MKLNSDNWVPCLLQAADDYSEVSGVLYNDPALVVHYRLNGAAAQVKSLTLADWSEGVDGGYSIRFSAAECNQVGQFDYWVDYTSCKPYPGSLEITAAPESVDLTGIATEANADANKDAIIGAMPPAPDNATIAAIDARIPEQPATFEQVDDVKAHILRLDIRGNGIVLRKFKSCNSEGTPLSGVRIICFKDDALSILHGGVQYSNDEGETYWMVTTGTNYWFVQQKDGYSFPVKMEVG